VQEKEIFPSVVPLLSIVKTTGLKSVSASTSTRVVLNEIVPVAKQEFTTARTSSDMKESCIIWMENIKRNHKYF
jgi:hypothetical protein